MDENNEFEHGKNTQNSINSDSLLLVQFLRSTPFVVLLCVGLAILTWLLGIICLILQEASSDIIVIGVLGLSGGIILLISVFLTAHKFPLNQKLSPQMVGGLGGTAFWFIGTTLTLLAPYETRLFGFLFESPESFKAHANDPYFYIKLIIAPFIILSGLIGDLVMGVLMEKYFSNVYTERYSV